MIGISEILLGFALAGAAAATAAWRRSRAAARRHAARARRRGDELQAIMTSLSSGLLMVDHAGRVRLVSQAGCRILFCERADLVDVPLIEAFDSGWDDFVFHVQRVLARGEGVERTELVIHRPDGVDVPVGLSVDPLFGADGRLSGAVAIFQDLTEVTRMRDRVRDADRMAAVGELAASIAHEIRNPLGSIRGSAELLAADLELAGSERRLLDLILRESERVNRLISDFLVFARQRESHPTLVHLEPVLQDVAHQVAVHRGDAAGPPVKVSCDPEDLILNADQEHLRQVLLNLGLNALQIGGPGVAIELAAVLNEDETCSITVRDDGPGIAPEVRDSLFQPFVTSRPGGTGLGLATARRIALAHGGTLGGGDRPGGGAEFELRLPLLAPQPRRTPAAKTPEPVGAPA